YHFPAEWELHEATWLSFPKNSDTWGNRFEKIYPPYFKLIEKIAESEKVRINAHSEDLISFIRKKLVEFEISENNIELYAHATNDSWCRDHGPTFLKKRSGSEKAIVDWEYNAWGGKYPPYDADNAIPAKIGQLLDLPVFKPGIVMEGGSIEVNGMGALLTSESCLLNKNRNPHLSKRQIEEYLINYYCVEQIMWLKDGIVGDDTDGHIDDTTRFASEETVLACIEHNASDDNYEPLKANYEQLNKLKFLNGKSINIVELPMPDAVFSAGERLPASYANFCVTNKYVIVPTYRCSNDETALEIISKAFPGRQVVGIDSTEIIWGLGSFHCLSQQEPA
ncbi:MAG: agmatine deiminase family protein, partial [Spirosomaceae bacterium]|nr:agmatine deiminase family protein [Spirosomataceae bacterium]